MIETIKEQINLNSIFTSFRIRANCTKFEQKYNLLQYDITLHSGARIREVEKYLPEITLALRAPSAATLKTVMDEGIIRLEFIKKGSNKISLFDFGSKCSRPSGKLPCLLGQSYDGVPIWMDIAAAPHTLIAGCTASGKSTLLHNLIGNLLLFPNAELIIFDPKNIDYFHYQKMKSKKIRVYSSYQECLSSLQRAITQMEQRYVFLREGTITPEQLPYTIIMIDEYADLVSQDEGKQLQSALARLAQKARAANMHLIVATQRPSVDVLTGTIKANMPARIACKVSSSVDSRVVLDQIGAEKLLGNGDALLKNETYQIQRLQVAHTSPEEICHYVFQK